MIVFFDGVCNLCVSSVKFIIKRDRNIKFKFVSFQSETGKKLLHLHEYKNKEFDTLILLKNEKIYTKSTAALLISKELNGLWNLLYVFIVLPKLIRDPLYLFISNNRYKWFGKKDFCWLPSPEHKSRFLE
ncbi:MAG: DUF393 domain-containing protein [Bacteroidetes bacterium]|nr:DUF393 domain-containing protein [Bacteroidota bacterium]